MNKITNLSVIIPTYNCKHYLKLCLDSLFAHARYKKHEVIVCVDGSTDGTWEMLEDLKNTYPFLEVIGFPENIGECTAMNRSVEHANNELIFTVNDDMVFMPDWDYNLIKEYNKGTSDVLSCRLIEPGLIKVNKMFIEENCGISYKEFDMDKFISVVKNNLKEIFNEDSQNQPMLLKKVDFIKAGGWDERFNTGPLSDPDFYIKLLLSGTKFSVTHNVIFYHFSGKATRFAGESKETTKSYRLNEYDNSNIFYEKWGFLPVGDPFKNFMVLPPYHIKGITFPWVKKGLYEIIIKKIRDMEKEKRNKLNGS